MGCSKSSSKREVYSNSISPQETRKISNKQSNLTPKTFNYVAIGDDIAAGINTDEEHKSYATLIKEDYEGKGYTVNYSNYSQSYYGSNEIRENLASYRDNCPAYYYYS